MLADSLIQKMYADYQAGVSFYAVARIYNRTPGCIRELFARRKLPVRPYVCKNKKGVGKNGCFKAYPEPTITQLNDMIDRATKIMVPPELKTHWRHWTLKRRADFLSRLRMKFISPEDQPQTPFSDNVEPFDYGTEKAHAIARQFNVGKTSQLAGTKIKLPSQGVIWRGQLFFWARDNYYVGNWTPEHGRPSLNRIIWEDHHQRKIPAKHHVSYQDGNRNNLDPKNLVLLSFRDAAIKNKGNGLLKKSRGLTALLLQKQQNAQTNENVTVQKLLARGKARK